MKPQITKLKTTPEQRHIDWQLVAGQNVAPSSQAATAPVPPKAEPPGPNGQQLGKPGESAGRGGNRE